MKINTLIFITGNVQTGKTWFAKGIKTLFDPCIVLEAEDEPKITKGLIQRARKIGCVIVISLDLKFLDKMKLVPDRTITITEGV